MINGRILVSQPMLTSWIQEALEHDRNIKESGDSPTDYRPNGWSLINYRIDAQCKNWDFGAADQKLLVDHMQSIYSELHTFLELDTKKRTGT